MYRRVDTCRGGGATQARPEPPGEAATGGQPGGAEAVREAEAAVAAEAGVVADVVAVEVAGADACTSVGGIAAAVDGVVAYYSVASSPCAAAGTMPNNSCSARRLTGINRR